MEWPRPRTLCAVDVAGPVPEHVVEQPIVIENRKTLSYLLCEAGELEHGLLCEYLYAAFSLKQQPDDGLPAERLPDVERWRSELLKIAGEEMLHWALVNNLLTAIGSAPFVSRPHMPHQAKGYPPGVQLALLRFGEQALRHIVFLERPEGMDLADAEGFEPGRAGRPRCHRGCELPARLPFQLPAPPPRVGPDPVPRAARGDRRLRCSDRRAAGGHGPARSDRRASSIPR